jgi:hypothetical protein
VKHPGEFELALFAGGDLGFWERRRVRRHLRQCSDCRAEAEAFARGDQELRALTEQMPEGVNWTRLSQEMTGNIRVGLAAGECVGPVPVHRPRSLAWHAMAVMGAAFVIVMAALWVNVPRDEKDHLFSALRSIPWGGHRTASMVAAAPDSVVLEASPASIELRANGGTMSILTPGDAASDGHTSGVAVSVSMQGSAGAQYVDSDTGQVTVSRLYYAQ